MSDRILWWLLRIIGVIVTLWILTVVSFAIVVLAPGDPAMSLLRVDDVVVSREELDALREQLGVNDPIRDRYFSYLHGLVQGDLGTSAMTGRPVTEEIMGALPATGILAGLSLLLTTVMVLVLGWLAAKYRDTWVDKTIMGFCYLGASIASFWLGLLLISLFSVRLGWLPASGWHNGAGLVLPVFVLAVAIAPPFVKIFRNGYVETSRRDFIRAAVARGVPDHRVGLFHTARGSVIPVITMLAVSLGSLLSGSVVVEVVFGLPGVGKLAVEAVARRDYGVIQGFVLVVGVLILVIMMLVDVINQRIDPSIRIREQEQR